MHRFMVMGVIFAGIALVTPVAVSADDHHEKQEKRYYDRDGRDYHAWNDHEDRAYRLYLGEQHREYVEFGKVRSPRQREYFRWRHDHPDGVLFKLEIR